MDERHLKEIPLEVLNGFTLAKLRSSEKLICPVCNDEIPFFALTIHQRECEKILYLKGEISKLHKQGLTDIQIAKQLNVPSQSITRYRRELKLIGNKMQMEFSEKIKVVNEVYHNGKRPSSIEIAKETGFSRSTVCKALKELGLESWTDIIQREEEEIYLKERANGLNGNQISIKYGYTNIKVNRMKNKFGY